MDKPKPRVPLPQLIEAAERAGARDPKVMAACIFHGARENGIEPTIALWRRNRPDLFWPVVGHARPPKSTRKEQIVAFARRRNVADAVSEDATGASGETEPP